MIPLGTYDDVADLLQLSKQTIYGKTSNKQFPEGVYLGNGRFNMVRIQEHINAGTLFSKTNAGTFRSSGSRKFSSNFDSVLQQAKKELHIV